MLEKNILKRKFSNKDSYEDMLATHSVADLKNIAKAWTIKGISKLKKEDLVKAIVQCIDENLEEKLYYFNLDHISIVAELLKGHNVCHKYPVAADELIGLGLVLEGSLDNEISLVMPFQVTKMIKQFYDEKENVVTVNTLMKDFMELMISLYGVIRTSFYVDTFYEFYDQAVEKDYIESMLEQIVTRTRNVLHKDGILYYYRLKEYEKVLSDVTSKDDFDYKTIDSKMLQNFVKNNNSLWQEHYQTLDKVIKKHFPHRDTVDLIDELLIMSAYNHGISDYIQLFSKKEESSDMVALKSFADTILTINTQINHWELKGLSMIERSTIKQKPVVKGDKVGRNESCPCGSGKKYKKCCMNKDDRK